MRPKSGEVLPRALQKFEDRQNLALQARSSGNTGRRVGSALTIEFEMEGQKFVILNGGPLFSSMNRFRSSSSNEQDGYQSAGSTLASGE
jgi:predicted 3-demethylubiquinone-9 3-methyltransferase (glyoxalase superfamily)